MLGRVHPRSRRRGAVLLAVAVLSLALTSLSGGGAAAAPDPDVVPGAWIVVLNDGAGGPASVAAEHARVHEVIVGHVYDTALRGYSARMSEQAIARIARDPRVAYVEPDRVVTTAHHVCGHTHPKLGDGSCEPPPADTTTYSVSGTITNGSSAISGANVTLVETGASMTTDGSGAFAFSGLVNGIYNVKATASDYQDGTAQVTVAGADVIIDDLTLTALAPPPDSNQTTPWGIERIGPYPAGSTGSGVHVYVIDTGIDLRHADLNVSSQGFASESCRGGGCQAKWHDDHGHGTHVAGTIGALDNDLDVVGVAPGVTLHAVKVLSKSGSGTRSGVIAGINWVAGHNTGTVRVANMSLGGSGSKTGTCAGGAFTGADAYHQALCAATATGVVFAVAAGNSGADAAKSVPAAYDDTVLTVSATSSASDWPSWSNWGEPVTIAAPGVDVLSTRAGGGTTTMSGTSMAAPHVAGAAALYLDGRLTADGVYKTFTDTQSALLSSVQPTDGWSNNSGHPHVEGFLQVEGL